MKLNDPAPVVVDDAIFPAAANPADPAERSDSVAPAAEDVVIAVVPNEAEPPPTVIAAATDTQPPVGVSVAPIKAALIGAVRADPPVAAVVTPTFF